MDLYCLVLLASFFLGKSVMIEKSYWIMGTSALTVLKNSKIIFICLQKLCNKILKVPNDVPH
jgi:hypothetical protein